EVTGVTLSEQILDKLPLEVTPPTCTVSSLADLEAKKSSYTGTADSGDEIVLGSVNQIPNEDENEVMDEDHVGKDNTPENEENVEKEAVEEEGDNAMPVPQVRISEDGTIVVNEASLLVEASPPKTHDHCDSEVVYEKASYTTYASFKKKTHTSAWTDRETNKFYKALSTVGTDFTLINAILPNRTRHEIKNKFKKEERINRGLVDHAIKLRKHFDMSVFEQTESDIEAEKEEQRKRDKKQRKSKSYKPRQKRGRKKKTSSKQKHKEDDDESDADVAMESNEEEEAESKDGDDNEEEDVEINTILGKPTRSGRQPKIVKSFTVNTECLGRKRRGRAKDIPQGSILAVPTLQTQKTANEFDKYASPSVASDTSDSHKEKQDTPTVHKETINDAQTPGSDTQGSLVAAGENIVIIHNPGSGSSRNIVIVHTPNARNAASALVTSPDIAAAGIETTPLSGMKVTQLMVNDVQQIQASNHGSQIDEVINNNADVSKITVDNETTVVDSLDNCAVIESLVNSGVIESLSNKRTSESVVTDDGVIDTLDSGEIITPSECSEIIEVEDNLIEVEDVETSDIIESSDEFMGAEAVVEINASQHVSRGIMMTATSLPFIPPTVPVTTSSSITNVINMNIKDHTD
ncbi:uncharacterized protein LOC102810121, partial [Saccoglossus kowalevskii]|uniref:Transcription factor TFIIIB component B'' homolog n=1 Tax=Saccoglossus kowalevskii TaxID=10224 RepID=A0ABM0MXC1_SACKO